MHTHHYLLAFPPVSTSPDSKRDTEEEPYYDYIQEMSTYHTTESDHPPLPIETSINTAYGAAQDLGMCAINTFSDHSTEAFT